MTLRKRKQITAQDENATPIEINTEATGVELHKDSKYVFQWFSCIFTLNYLF